MATTTEEPAGVAAIRGAKFYLRIAEEIVLPEGPSEEGKKRSGDKMEEYLTSLSNEELDQAKQDMLNLVQSCLYLAETVGTLSDERKMGIIQGKYIGLQ